MPLDVAGHMFIKTRQCDTNGDFQRYNGTERNKKNYNLIANICGVVARCACLTV